MKTKWRKGVRMRKEEFDRISLSKREEIKELDKIEFEILSQIKNDTLQIKEYRNRNRKILIVVIS